jgi:hypothetical protein
MQAGDVYRQRGGADVGGIPGLPGAPADDFVAYVHEATGVAARLSVVIDVLGKRCDAVGTYVVPSGFPVRVEFARAAPGFASGATMVLDESNLERQGVSPTAWARAAQKVVAVGGNLAGELEKEEAEEAERAEGTAGGDPRLRELVEAAVTAAKKRAVEAEAAAWEGDGRAARAEAQAALDAWVAQHAEHARQRTAGWYARRPKTIGGSDLPALLGMNGYKTYAEVVGKKAGALGPRPPPSIAMVLGTVYEGATEAYIAVDCGAPVVGGDLSIPARAWTGMEGLHWNSPDGYVALELWLSEGPQDPAGGAWRIARTDAATQAAAAGRPRRGAAARVEIKNPLARRPTGAVPREYRAQLWSGLELAPPAEFGLYVDAVTRRCALEELGPAPGYDAELHDRDDEEERARAPLAWGFAAVYAPTMAWAQGRPAGAARGKALQAATAAARAYRAAFGLAPPRGGGGGLADVIDLGRAEAADLLAVLVEIDARRFAAGHWGPVFADGRGPVRGDWGRAVEGAARGAPAGWRLLGVLPWKILDVAYAIEERRPGFAAEAAPVVRAALEAAAALRAEPDTARAWRKWARARRAARTAKEGPRAPTAEALSLFAAVAGDAPGEAPDDGGPVS